MNEAEVGLEETPDGLRKTQGLWRGTICTFQGLQAGLHTTHSIFGRLKKCREVVVGLEEMREFCLLFFVADLQHRFYFVQSAGKPFSESSFSIHGVQVIGLGLS